MSTETIEAPAKKMSRAEKMFAKQKATVRSAIISATAQFHKKNGYDVASQSAADAGQIKLLSIINTGGWCSSNQKESLLQCLEHITGKPIPRTLPVGKALQWVRFACIVPINPGVIGHNYPINRPAIVYADFLGYKNDGVKGNTMDNNSFTFRPAIIDDINTISDETYAALIREFLVMA